METWVALALVYPIMYAFANLIDKFLVDKRVKNCFSVNDVLLVSCLETLSRLDGDIECFVELEGPVLDHLLDAT